MIFQLSNMNVARAKPQRFPYRRGSHQSPLIVDPQATRAAEILSQVDPLTREKKSSGGDGINGWYMMLLVK